MSIATSRYQVLDRPMVTRNGTTQTSCLVESLTLRALTSLPGLVLILVLPLNSHADNDQSLNFNQDIRPILSDKCFRCHGPDATHRKADLRLDEETDAKRVRESYQVIKPMDPKGSALVDRIVSEEPEEQMPPPESNKALTEAEKQTLIQWIQEGAPWDVHWAYQAPRKAAPPSVQNKEWPLNWIDNWILKSQEMNQLAPNKETSPSVLLRRLSYDLLGLPPSSEEVQAFEADPSEAHYEALIKRYLASPHFGERMATYWLDLVRYADTVGYHGDQDHNISPYRDWVIQAFNEDLPFDQFTEAQLAGDLKPNATQDDLIASGYNRLLQTSHEGGVQPKEYLAIYAADRVRNVSSVWLGGTLGCAQCHDHKYDPYTAHDFYAMSAFFADLDEESHFKTGTNALPTRRAPEIHVLSRWQRDELEDWTSRLPSLHGPNAELAKRQIANLKKEARLTMISKSKTPRTVRILPRGNWLDETGEIVEPAVPSFLGQLEDVKSRASRLDLAAWLTQPHGIGPFTARVQANRLWSLFFGRGLARSLDDIGAQGTPPTHPELLDNLAIYFVDQGWSVKRLIQAMVMSRTYRQSSVPHKQVVNLDPANDYFTRQERYRLQAEFIRDNALMIAGLLQLDIGGPSMKPYQPEGYYKHLNFPKRTYYHSTDRQQWRRGLYVHWQRQFLHPMLRATDAPSREECTSTRPQSNTPLAALALLNDPTFVEAARALAEKALLSHPGTDNPQKTIAWLFERTMKRPPDEREHFELERLLEDTKREFESNPEQARRFNSVGQSAPNPNLDPIHLAAWSSVSRALLNLNESFTRN